MSKIRVAIAGVGNCASSLIQGVEYYRDADPSETVPGLMHVVLGGYHVADLDFVAAFDADATKVGTDLGKAAFAGQNNTIRFASVGDLGVTVQRGPTLDGFGTYYRQIVEESPAEPVDVAAALRDAKADVLVSYLPVGSEEAQRHYAAAALEAGVAFVNAIPVFIASDPEWARRFAEAGADVVLVPSPGTVPGFTVDRAGELARAIHEAGGLALMAIGTCQEGSDEDTIRQIALGAKMAGADLHHLGDCGFSGMAPPENILAYSVVVKGRTHTYRRMAASLAR